MSRHTFSDSAKLRAGAAAIAILALLAGPARANLTLRMEDFATAPMTGSVAFPSATQASAYLARINFLSEDPVDANRLFVNDQNGPLYVLDRTTRQFTQYMDFDGRGAATGLFPRLYTSGGYATGLVTLEFDPDYANNGKFYTVHVEQGSGSKLPDASAHPGFDPTGYTTTASINAPGFGGEPGGYQNVLVEWTDTNPVNATFEGTARELLRIGQASRIHPMGDIVFNPNAAPGDADWRMMYVAIGDGATGENGSTRSVPQTLDNLAGKILRIRPDDAGATAALTASTNGRYFVPDDNPFTQINNAAVRDEVYALGLRNPHRLSWDGPTDSLIANDIGLHTWEEVNIIHAGGNYGYADREGNQRLNSFYQPVSLPGTDEIDYYATGSTVAGAVMPLYPVAQYGHGQAGSGLPEGDAISSGFIYRGANIPSLQGKYVFGDVSTGQLFWLDVDEMLAADDGNPATLADIHLIDVAWDSGGGEQVYTTVTPGGDTLGPMHQIVEIAYHGRGGQDPNLPGGAQTTGGEGRADVRWQVDAAGELYLLSKSDGMIRYVVAALGDADFNADGAVDGSDLLAWQRHAAGAGDLAQGDADADGLVTAADLGFWRDQYGAAAAIATVPEPANVALAVLAVLGGFATARSERSPSST
ncbi:MAG: hypothetical protein CMJ58_21010 [Planctomycetaceae bacterium]|nr:hypothetical protein [Planctomycetaceae bacterium]